MAWGGWAMADIRLSSAAWNDSALSGLSPRRSVRGHAHRESMARRVRREPPQPCEQAAALDLRADHRRQHGRPAVVFAGAASVACRVAVVELGHGSAGRSRGVLRGDIVVARARHGAVRGRGARMPGVVADSAMAVMDPLPGVVRCGLDLSLIHISEPTRLLSIS